MNDYILKFIVSWFLIFSLSFSFSQGTWEIVDVPTAQNLSSVCFADSLHGWAVGDFGTIIHTSDGGETWVIQDSQTENEIVDVFFLNKNLGWASSFKFDSFPYGTLLLKTTDGGQNWVTYPYPQDNIFINCILYLDSLNGWMGGSPHAIVKTTNGGMDWQQVAVDTSVLAFFPVLNIKFYDENYGYACGGMFDIAGVIWRTTNGGISWSALSNQYAPADEVHQIHLFDSIHVMGAGGDPDFGYGVAFMRTWDGGSTWDYEEIEIQGNAFDLDFRTESEVWCPLGPRRKLIYSTDSGDTWGEVITPDSVTIYDVDFPDSLHGFAVGKEGAFIKYIPPVQTSVSERLNEENYHLNHINFPNPFRGKTAIKFTIPGTFDSPQKTELTIYNIYGKKILTLVDGFLSPDDYEFLFDGANFPAGIYFYVLKIENPQNNAPFSVSKQMILLK